ncbi:MAG: dynamin family protein, partial [Chitinophagales bacterium]
MNQLINQQFEHYKTLIDDIFKELHQLTLSVQNTPLATTVDDIRTRLNEPYLFVIVGEVKVGKSSFINALLEAGKEVTKVAPDPCTDTIQQIVYGEVESVIPINEFLRKITVPAEILKEIAIVDTPGTNTIVDQHTEITERFIPVSDLIVFVFEAKNPYRQSAWDFLDFVSKEWHKKVVFVLQQKDLMEPDDLVTNIKGVERLAVKHGINDPKIFTVSAKQEIKGDKENSGYIPLREYIHNTVTGGGTARLKVQSLIQTSQNIKKNIQEGLNLRSKQLQSDESFRYKVNSLMDNADQKSQRQIDAMVGDLLKEYDKITYKIKQDFEDGLGTFTLIKKSIFSLFGNEETLEEWLEKIKNRIEKELKPALEHKIRDGVVNIAESIRQMAEIIDAEIRQNEAILKSNHQVFGDIANKRQDKLDKLHLSLNTLIEETSAFIEGDLLRKSEGLMPNITTGGSIMVIGGILAAVTTGIAFDITGGVLATLGLGIATLLTASKRRQVIQEFHDEIAKG